MKYRASLGKEKGVANLVTDGGFVAACGVNWTCGAGWALGGIATHGGGAGSFLYQDNVFEAGEEYSIKFDAVIPAGKLVRAYIGNYSIDELIAAATGTIEVDNLINLSTSQMLSFYVSVSAGVLNLTIDNVEVYRWDWNDPEENIITEWDQNSKEVRESNILDQMKMKYIEILTFVNNGFDYLLDAFETYGIGHRVPVKIENWNPGLDDWELWFEGTIPIESIRIDYEKSRIDAPIEQNYGEIILQQNIDNKIPLYINSATLDFWRSITPGAPPTVRAPYDGVKIHDLAAGGYFAQQHPIVQQIRGLEEVMVQASRMRVLPSSTFLSNTIYDDAGNPIWLGFTRGENLRGAPTGTNLLADISINEYLSNYSRLTNLVYWSDRDANNIPCLFIEDKASIITLVPTLNLTNVKLEPAELANEHEYQNIYGGYDNYDNTDEKFQFFTQAKGLSEDLDIESDFVRDPYIIDNQRTGANTDFDQVNVWMEYWWDPGIPEWRSYQWLVGAVWSYNEDIVGYLYPLTWMAFLGTVYQQSDDDTNLSTPLAAPLFRIFEFDYPLTKDQYDQILGNLYDYIGVEGFGVDTRGEVKEIKVPMKNDWTGMATCRIKVLAE